MRTAIVDLECTSLKSNRGILLSGGIKPYGTSWDKGPCKVITYADTGFKQGRYAKDAKLALAIRDEIEKYDILVTWNGIMFDVPFLNNRLMAGGHRILKQMWHIDVMYQARQGKSCLTSSRLDSVARWLNCPMQKTQLDMNLWMEAEYEVFANFAHGRKNYDYITKHCDVDLRITEFVYDHFKPMIRQIQRRG